jgi:pimeloyl-ACP methyl ester carboxylesterase
VALLVPLGLGGPTSAKPSQPDGLRPTIVLVDGDWADASSWSAVIERPQRRGNTVVAPPNPLRGPTSEAAYLASFRQTIPRPIVLVAHSDGGFVAASAGTGNDNIRALVHVDAFIPIAGQTLLELAEDSCLPARQTAPLGIRATSTSVRGGTRSSAPAGRRP